MNTSNNIFTGMDESTRFSNVNETPAHNRTLVNPELQTTANDNQDNPEESGKGMPTWKKVTIGTASAVVLAGAGVGGYFLLRDDAKKGKIADNDDDESGEGNDENDDIDVLTAEDYADTVVDFAGSEQETAYTGHHTPLHVNVPVADSVNDSMTFGEAFDAARAEVGPGGVFEWHGQVYGTYTGEEWSNMSEAEQNQFAYNCGIATQQHHSDMAAAEVPVMDHTDETHEMHNVHNNAHQSVAEVPTEDGGDSEVTVLGVFHDDDSNMNMGLMTIDNDEVVLLDIDNDNVFDIGVIDLNHDGQVQEDEIFDIADAEITVDDLNTYNSPAGFETTADTEIPGNDDLYEI